MSRTPVIVSTLCPVCQGDGKLLSKNCGNCKATGLIHTPLVQK